MRRIFWFIGVLAVTALACNAPIERDETPSPPPTSAETGRPTAAVPTESPTAGAGIGADETPETLPTFTPIQATAPPGATVLPGATVTNAPTATATSAASTPATPTETADSGPLSFTYSIEWEVNEGNPAFATATVTIVATGGGGGYQYFRDDLLVEGPVFTYQWATCRANPGSLRVDSADGQSVRTDYFETPPCPATPGG